MAGWWLVHIICSILCSYRKMCSKSKLQQYLQGCQHCVLKMSRNFATGHRPAQAQEMTAGTGHSSRFCLGSQNFFAKQTKNTGILGFLLGVLWWNAKKNVVVSGIYKKSSRKVCNITNSLRSQTEVWKLATLSICTIFYRAINSLFEAVCIVIPINTLPQLG